MFQLLFKRLWKCCSTMSLGLNLSGMCWKRNCLCHHPFYPIICVFWCFRGGLAEELPGYAWLSCPLTGIFALFLVFFGAWRCWGEFFLNTVILDCNTILVRLQMKKLIQFWTLQSYMWKATEKAWRKTVRTTWKARFSHYNSFVGMTALKEHKILQEHKRKEESNLSLLSVVDRNRN